MNLFSLPVRRPVATSMFFVAIFLLGGIAWLQIPVELIPPIEGQEIYVQIVRLGSDPEVVEREILLPLEARVRELPDVEETRGEVRGSRGSFTVKFGPGVDLQLRELDVNRISAELARAQPPGTLIQVALDPLTLASRFVMYITVSGMDDLNSLLHLVDERVTTPLAAVPGVSQVLSGGAAPREMTVRIDPDRCAALGLSPSQVETALARAVRRTSFLGGAEDEAGRTAVVLDGRPRGEVSLASTRIAIDRPVELRHVADVRLGGGGVESLYRVNGKPTVGLVVYLDAEANLVKLGADLRRRMDELKEEFAPYGIEFFINFDAAETVEEQLDRLKSLALSGFVIALAVLFLFLRQWRAVGVVAVAVPASLLAALAMLFLAGQTINVVTLFGLAVGIGMLVDNSIVVYEAVQRQLERRVDPDRAAEYGVRRTVRAILAASATNAVVFLPIAFTSFDDPFLRSTLQVLVVAILLPMVGSVIVAVGLVPLLARRLAAPAAMARIETLRRRRDMQGGLRAPDRLRELFGALMTVALRRPGIWITGVVVAVLLTLIPLGIVIGNTAAQEPPEATEIQFPVDIAGGDSLDSAAAAFEQLEHGVLDLPGVERVESLIREEGGSLTVHLLPSSERPDSMNAGRVRGIVRATAAEIAGLEIRTTGSGGGGPGGGGGLQRLMGGGPSKVVISGPDARQLTALAREIKDQALSIPEITTATIQSREGQSEIRITPNLRALVAYGLTGDQLLPALRVISREGVRMRTGFTLHDGQEIPMTVRREPSKTRASDELRRLPLATSAGVLPLGALAHVHRMPPAPTIVHKNGRREIEVHYMFGPAAPTSGPAREELERQVRTAFQEVHRPAGYTIETPTDDESFSWFRAILLPVLLLLFAVLAVTFESPTMPLLVLLSLPLTVFGATWALFLTGTPAVPMTLMGALALIGITVNPAILLVDRMQQRAWQGGMTAGAAALGAVRERARPVLMTATTTIAGLWPLAIVTGRANEIWPPFATVVMGGLVTSTLLTLLVIPVGFVFLHRLDSIFGRLGPWVVLGWVGLTAGIMTPLIMQDVITSLTWRFMTTILVSGLLLGIAVLVLRRPDKREPATDDGPPSVDVRCLNKTYDLPGPVGRAWRVQQRFAESVVRAGGTAFDPRTARGRLVPLLMVAAGAFYMAFSVNTIGWKIIFLMSAAALIAWFFREIRKARGRADEFGRVDPGGVESLLAALCPWAALAYLTLDTIVLPENPELRVWVPSTLAGIVLVTQLGRRTALQLARGAIEERLDRGRLRRTRTLWRRLSRSVFGVDLPRKPVRAVSNAAFTVDRGMVGILGPNGAGKTTLLRMLAGILDPTVGTIHIGGVPLAPLRKKLARYVGYLPQDFGLPQDLTAREYLEYYALLYQIEPAAKRTERIESLLTEVGLQDRADEKIGGFSGGMRQRVAVARTLLRLPPIIIVDEPTVGLDPRERIRFRNLLARLAEGRVVLFSTHVVEDVEVACERVIVFATARTSTPGNRRPCRRAPCSSTRCRTRPATSRVAGFWPNPDRVRMPRR